MKRKLMAFVAQLVGATTLLAPIIANAQVVVVPPPVYHYERLPPPRHGMVWHSGYWRWANGAYVWTPGVWAPVVVEPGPYRVVVVSPPPAPPPPRVERLSADALFPFDKGGVNDIRPQGLADIAQIAAQSGSHRAVFERKPRFSDPMPATESARRNCDLRKRSAAMVANV